MSQRVTVTQSLSRAVWQWLIRHSVSRRFNVMFRLVSGLSPENERTNLAARSALYGILWRILTWTYLAISCLLTLIHSHIPKIRCIAIEIRKKLHKSAETESSPIFICIDRDFWRLIVLMSRLQLKCGLVSSFLQRNKRALRYFLPHCGINKALHEWRIHVMSSHCLRIKRMSRLC